MMSISEKKNFEMIIREYQSTDCKEQLKLILAWCVLHQDELMQNWELAKDGKSRNKIAPLM